jgi:hypothetical protein
MLNNSHTHHGVFWRGFRRRAGGKLNLAGHQVEEQPKLTNVQKGSFAGISSEKQEFYLSWPVFGGHRLIQGFSDAEN